MEEMGFSLDVATILIVDLLILHITKKHTHEKTIYPISSGDDDIIGMQQQVNRRTG
jgi:hypothetical protein